MDELAGGGVDTDDVADDDGRESDHGGEADDDGEEADDSDDSAIEEVEEQSSSHGAVMVSVKAPSLRHASWDEWQSYFIGYCERTLQVLPVKETMSREQRNRRLQRTRRGADPAHLVPFGCDPYQRTYICTHGRKKRKSRSEGSRPRQHIRHTDCPFRFVVQWNLSRMELEVKHGRFVHNHPVSRQAFATYPSSRGMDNELISARVGGMLAVGAKRSRIYDYLLEHDQNVSSDDASQVDAFVHKMVYADSAAAYDAAHVAFRGLCDRIGISGFFSYFEKNWHSSQELEKLPRLPDYTYTLLYRLTPDAAIRACCDRLVMDNPSCRFAGLQTASATTKRTRSKDAELVDVSVRNRIMDQVQEDGVDTVFLPVNFRNAHWCCLVIKVQPKRIFFYDPLNQAPYKNACSKIATILKVSGLQDYDVVAQNNRIQFDAFSCGVYVCWMFLKHAKQGLRVDMTGSSLPRRRFELFFYLKTGRLLTTEPGMATGPPDEDDEEKQPPPSQDQDEEQLPATQVAQ